MTEAHPTGRCSRCHQRGPAGAAPPAVLPGTAPCHHARTDARLPQATPVCDATPARPPAVALASRAHRRPYGPWSLRALLSHPWG
jgi:hypothetical protein